MICVINIKIHEQKTCREEILDSKQYTAAPIHESRPHNFANDPMLCKNIFRSKPPQVYSSLTSIKVDCESKNLPTRIDLVQLLLP